MFCLPASSCVMVLMHARKGIWKSRELEQALCTRLNCGYAQLTSSGTSALTTALAALGIGAGDEVIMPSFTFVASFEAVLSVGAIPVLVDVNDSLTMDPVAVRKAINSGYTLYYAGAYVWKYG